MEYVGIGICIVVVIAVGVILYLKSVKKKEDPSGEVFADVSASSRDGLVEANTTSELIIQMEMLPAEAFEDESKLVEITDSKVLAHVSNLVPGLEQARNIVSNVA